MIAIIGFLFKLGPSDFAWQWIQLVPTNDVEEDDDNHEYDENNSSFNSSTFKANSSKFCTIVDLNNMYIW